MDLHGLDESPELRVRWFFLLFVGCGVSVVPGAHETCQAYVDAIAEKNQECGRTPMGEQQNQASCDHTVWVSPHEVFDVCIPKVKATACADWGGDASCPAGIKGL